MISSRFRIASVGDIHLGHPRTETVDILHRLTKAFPDTSETGDLDLIVLEGDVFDRQLAASDANWREVVIWVDWFLRMCARRNIIVRVLEGTRSHDWGQSSIFETVQSICNIELDLRYVDTVSVEHHALGFSVLYVPDDWKPDNNDTYMEVMQLFKEEGIEQVDFAVMHGTFEHQLPPNVDAPIHVAERYLALVRHYIFVGHIHYSSVFKRILAAGSFDRLGHNEEGPKGHFRLTVDPKHGDEIVFVENTEAQTYLTLDCTGYTLEQALDRLHTLAPTLREGSYLRIAAHRDSPLLVNMEQLRRQYPHVSWSTKATIGDLPQSNLLVDLRGMHEEIEITSRNVVDLLNKRMVSKNHAPDLIARCMAQLELAL